ncbi:MAG: agmatinase [Thermoplasmatota archaeon]
MMNFNTFNLVPVDPGFADANSDFSNADYVIFGVPFDATASHLSGAHRGPSGIREESYNFETYLMDLDVELEYLNICDLGDIGFENIESNQADILESVRALTEYIMDKEKLPIIIGGEHSISESSIDAFMLKYGRLGGLAVIIDAHLDFRDEYMRNPHSHACVTRRIVDRWGIDSVCLIGVRSGCRREVQKAREMGLRYFSSMDVRRNGIVEVLESLDTDISIRDRPLYLSIDIDGIDPSQAPGTGTPEPWGLNSWDIRRMMDELKGQIVVMDVMEVSPKVEKYITPGLAGKLIRRLIGLKETKVQHPGWLDKI